MQIIKLNFANNKQWHGMPFHMEDYEDYVEKVAKILDIDVPMIKIDSDELLDHSAAGYIKEQNTILLSERTLHWQSEDTHIAAYMLTAYALRRIWQEKYKYFPNGFDDPSINIEEYENQPREVDANAFAYLIIGTYFEGKAPTRGTWAIHSYDKVIERVYELERWFDIRMEEVFGEDGFVELDESILPPGLCQRYGHTRIFLNEKYVGLGMAITRDSGSLPLEDQYYRVYYFDLATGTLEYMRSAAVFERDEFSRIKEPTVPYIFNDIIDMSALDEDLLIWYKNNHPEIQ